MTVFQQSLADFVSLTKPRISLLCLLMFVGGYFYSLLVTDGLQSMRGLFSFDLLLGLVGTWLSVASANTLNMVWERHSDKLMDRTAQRPIPSGRMSAGTALAFGLGLGVLSALFLLMVNPVTFYLGMIALGGYVFVYTPLKKVTHQALIVGAIPGALPPLMGWTAYYGEVHPIGLILFGILILWQVPHFVAIAVAHKEDYSRAGIKVLPIVLGNREAVRQALIYSVALLAVSLLLVPVADAGAFYALTAVALGLWLIFLCVQGFVLANRAWARKVFFASLVYLPVLTGALVLEVLYDSRALFLSWSG